MTDRTHALDRLLAAVAARAGADPSESYTAKLMARGRPKIAQKLGEEAVETVIAALVQDRDALVAESADLLYHLAVLWAEAGVDPDDVWTELDRRAGTSGLAEKAARDADG
ncbi:MAG: phosphoribosyl-ATP diphosphatase [Alphaproteobacteria bacterium]|nr:phosphoribosyl-ATP diphosphatase [Alphaproteobacteria bacterium]